jgi:hypothetical protein
MTDALLLADQHLQEWFLDPVSWTLESGPYAEQTLDMNSVLRHKRSQDRPVWGNAPGNRMTTVEDQLAEGRRALAFLALLQQRAQRERQTRQEMKWLAENGRRFAGRWIALEGEQLLATGATSREVFSRVAGRAQPPLVIRIDEQELPFAGW